MINEQIVGYVASERARGVADEAIRGALVAQGWREDDVANAMGGGVFSINSSPKPFSFENLFEGRLGRWQYFITGLLFGFVFMLIGMGAVFMSYFLFDGLMYLFYALYALVIPLSVSLSIRRAHDLGWSGWYVLLLCIPFVNFVVSLLLLFKKGTEGVNTYGTPQPDRPFLRTLLNT